jgi:hypothetical protein
MKIGIACEYELHGKPIRSVLENDNLLDLLHTIKPLTKAVATEGSIDRPHANLNLSNWYYLSQQPSGNAPTYYSIGGRLIARWGKLGGQFVNYTTDITDCKEDVREAVKKEYEQFVRDLGTKYSQMDAKANINPKLPSYTRKALRIGDLDDVLAASLCRSLLADSETKCEECPELVASLCALMLCEAHRCPATFAITLMLLDLVESRTTYGQGGKVYTWKSMLMYGVDGDEIPGRGTGHKELGKHPMAGAETVTLGNLLFANTSGVNLVRDRVISILSIWSAHYLQKAYPAPKFKYFIVRADGGHGAWVGKRSPTLDNGATILKKALRTGVTERVNGPQLMIGGTTVGYQNLEGKTV